MKGIILFIKAKDVAELTGSETRTAQRVLQKVRRFVNKLPYRPVTAEEYCAYTGAREEVVRAYLMAKGNGGS